MTRYVVAYSGGATSHAAAARIIDEHGPDDVTLLFADTKVEDPDLYRFLEDGSAALGAELVKVSDGRTPFEVFDDVRFLGNNRVAPCSRELKVKPCREWLDENRDPEDTYVVVGIDWTEEHRLEAIHAGWDPFPVLAPMTQPPYLDKRAVLDDLKASGLEPPAGYAEGFPHNNCLEQGCVRGGITYWRQLLHERPEVFARTERMEQAMRDKLDADVAILRDRTGGTTDPLTLRELRKREETAVQGGPTLLDLIDDGLEWGGCGCFTDELEEPADV